MGREAKVERHRALEDPPIGRGGWCAPEKVAHWLRALAKDARPPGCEKLYDSIFRVRLGDVRIIYLVDDDRKRIEVGGIRRRSERTYGGIEDLFQ